MAVYAITGKLGSGKGKAGMLQLRKFFREGKRVATNCDVFVEHLDNERTRNTVRRIPDKPTATDLYLLGSGNPFVEFTPNIVQTRDGLKGAAPLVSPVMLPGFDESHNGILLLDECGSWLNTRNFQDKGRADLLEWMIHARKYGWDVYFTLQNIRQIDAQLRDSLFEYVVRLTRMDRMRVPVLSGLVSGVTAGSVSGNLPRVHVAVVRLGTSPDALVADRWLFQGDDLHAVYNTTQVFSESYPNGQHTLLSPWHLSARVALPADFVGPLHPGRPLELELVKPRAVPLKPPHRHMTKFLFAALSLGVVLGCAGMYFFAPAPSPVAPQVAQASKVNTPVAAASSRSVTAKGYLRQGGVVSVVLSDGSVVEPQSFTVKSGGAWEAQVSPSLLVSGVQP